MAVFVGTYDHSIDEKGRVVLPSQFRAAVAEGGILAELDQCLGLYTMEQFERMAEELEEGMHEGKYSAQDVRTFAAHAAAVKPDSQGRISIPQRLREFIHLDQKVTLIGRLKRVEIWDHDTWHANDTDEADRDRTQAFARNRI